VSKRPLWFWGLLSMTAGVGSGLFRRPVDVTTPEGRGEALGAGLAQLAFFIAGVVLIVMHFVRRKKKGTDFESRSAR
jgi:hypothetical protein